MQLAPKYYMNKHYVLSFSLCVCACIHIYTIHKCVFVCVCVPLLQLQAAVEVGLVFICCKFAKSAQRTTDESRLHRAAPLSNSTQQAH